jgi:hypothetical protein
LIFSFRAVHESELTVSTSASVRETATGAAADRWSNRPYQTHYFAVVLSSMTRMSLTEETQWAISILKSNRVASVSPILWF